MPYVFKTNELTELPGAQDTHVLTSKYSSVAGEIKTGENIFVFVEDGGVLGKYGGLVGRGTIVSANRGAGELKLEISFDRAAVTIPLENRNLRHFAHPYKYTVPEIAKDPIASIITLLTEIAEIRRSTKQQPIHSISKDAADWLNLYHFEREKI